MNAISYTGGDQIAPQMVLLESANLASAPRTVVHDILDGPPVHTLRPAGPSTGTLRIGFTLEVGALDCLGAHRTASVFTIPSTERAALNFSYVVAGSDLRVTLDDTAALWIVDVPFFEVI